MKTKVNTKGLFRLCFELSPNKDVIINSHLPFQDGFYVTERDVVLKVHNHTIYELSNQGWEKNQYRLSLWYDDIMVDFAEIPDCVVKKLGLKRDNVVKCDIRKGEGSFCVNEWEELQKSY